MQRSRNSVRKGFTLIELLVVVLILSILMAVALPLYLSAVADSQKKTCRANMQTIANAVQAWVVQNGPNTPPTPQTGGAIATTYTDLKAVPTCPSAGTYAVYVPGTASSFGVSCSAAGHGTFEPGVDHN